MSRQNALHKRASLFVFQRTNRASTRRKKTKTSDLAIEGFALNIVGMTGFEPATTRPPDVYSNRAELHPVCFGAQK